MCTFRTGCPIDISLLTELTYGHLSQRKFPAAIACMRLPTATQVIFHNGNYLLVGTHHRMDALLAAHLALRLLRRQMGLFPVFHRFVVCNVVCSLSLGHFLRVRDFYKDYRSRCMYNARKFDGCQFYYRRDPYRRRRATTFVIFSTGRIVITGGTSLVQEQGFLRNMLPLLRAYRCDSPQAPSGDDATRVDARLRAAQASAPSYTTVASSGPGGCLHEGSWVEPEDGGVDSMPHCSKCGTHAQPRQYLYRQQECEHNGEWVGLGTPAPVCCQCGLVDTDDTYCTRHQDRSRKRDNRIADRKRTARQERLKHDIRQGSFSSVQRTKRFKPNVEGTQFMVEAAAASSSTGTVSGERVPLQMFMNSAPPL
ncbi:MAG: hypothetical protein JKY23_04130 [Nitrospinaceae bacterium]|nr:hypothetical protein [Nitrospinaceae bacterium]